MKLKIFISMVVCFLALSTLSAQSRLIKGRVLNDKNEPLPGASVLEVGNERNGASCDDKGNFSVTMKSNHWALTFSAIGYLSQNIDIVNQQGSITIHLAPDTKGLEEVVVVGYGHQKRVTNTGAVSSIKGDEIKAIPTPGIQNTLAGRLPGFYSQQRSGQPGADAADFYIRGVNSLNGDSKPLIIVDDIEYTYDQVAQIDANEIESITILKDAATTAVYGIKGANGVLVITTKRGHSGKTQINITSELGKNKIIRMPTFLDAYSTAVLLNEAVTNDSYGLSTPKTLPFTANDLQKFKDGSDPYGHPNVNWVNTLINRVSTESRMNADISGGNSNVKYFTSLGYYSQNGNLKQTAPADGEAINNNFYYKRFNFRSNLDITPTKTLKLRFDIDGRFQTINTPAGYVNGNGVFYDLESYGFLAPYSMPLSNPNGTASSTNLNIPNVGYTTAYVNPVYRYANSGYNRTFSNNFNIGVGADQKLDFITKGLAATVTLSYAGNVSETHNLTRAIGNLPAYYYNSTTGSYTLFNASYPRLLPYSLAYANSAFVNTSIGQVRLDYDRTFGDHHVYGLGLINQRSIDNGAGAVPINYRGMSFRAGYDFKRKYMIEFDVARNGNDLFRPAQRYGVFPAASIGWNLSEEKFFKKLFPVFDLFKIRGSYGLVGSDVSYPSTVYDSIQFAQTASQYGFGNTSYNAVTGVSEGSLVNPYVTWETERKTDIGLDMNMLNGKIVISADYFYNFRYHQYIAQGDVSAIVGQGLPSKNIGQTQNTGVDGIITYRDRIGKVTFSVGVTASYAKNKIVYVSEAPDYPYQAKSGQQIGAIYMYHSIGFYQRADFNDNGSLKSSVAQIPGYTIQPGDLKYKDFNEDGQITSADKTYATRPNLPTTTYGLNLGMNYKGFSFNALIQGASDYQVYMQAAGAEAFASNLRPWHLDRWTPATANTATYPRIGVYGATTNNNNNSWNNLSDFWSINAGYVRLKSLEIGYQLPTKLLSNTKFIHSSRIYAAGYNLISINKMKNYQEDSEIASGQGNQYPNSANFNIGIQIGL